MIVVDSERSEHGIQRRKDNYGRLLHCCCICGLLEPWNGKWRAFYSIKELDDEVPIPKFCSEECQSRGGPEARNVTDEMKRKAKEAEWREPDLVYREQTEREKYADAADRRRREQNGGNGD